MIARLVGVIGTLVITRFLAPEVVGEVGVAVILVFSASQLTNLGFGQYVVARPRASRAAVFHATLFNALAMLIAMGGALLVAAPLAPLFDAPDMTRYVPGMAVAVGLNRLSMIPERIVVRDMRFRVFALGTGLPELVYVAVSLTLAARGWGGMSIVIANVCQHGTRVLIFAFAVAWRDWLEPARIDREITRDMLAFGAPLAVSNIAGFAATKWDNMLMASMFGTGIMGVYQLAYNLSAIPADYIGVAIGDVLMPSFAHMEPEHARKALVRSLRLLAIIIFPLTVGLGAVSESLVATLFNEQWQGIAPYLTVLATMAVAAPISDAIHVYLKARNMPRMVMMLALVGSSSLLAMVFLLGQLGSLAATVGVGVSGWLYSAGSLFLVHRCDHVSPARALAGIVGPLVACGVMVAAVFGVRLALAETIAPAPVVSLIVEIGTGAVTYVIAAFVFAPATARELIGLFRDSFLRRG